NAGPLPGDLDRDVGDISRHHDRAARGKWRHWRDGVLGEGIGASRPTAERIARHLEDGLRAHVSGDDERCVVRHVVSPEDLLEVLWRHTEHGHLVTDGILAYEPLAPQQLVDGMREREARFRHASL